MVRAPEIDSRQVDHYSLSLTESPTDFMEGALRHLVTTFPQAVNLQFRKEFALGFGESVPNRLDSSEGVRPDSYVVVGDDIMCFDVQRNGDSIIGFSMRDVGVPYMDYRPTGIGWPRTLGTPRNGEISVKFRRDSDGNPLSGDVSILGDNLGVQVKVVADFLEKLRDIDTKSAS